MSLTSPTNGKVRYRHNSRDGKYCDPSVNGEMLERHVLDFLYRFFLDEKAFNEAVKRKMPTADDRGRLVRDANRAKKQLLRVNRTIVNLVDAIAAGADVGLLLDKQDTLKAERAALMTRVDDLENQLASMPDPETLRQRASLMRFYLEHEFHHEIHRGHPWNKAQMIYAAAFNERWKETIEEMNKIASVKPYVTNRSRRPVDL